MKVFFIGMMGSGKTTLAKKLSELMNKSYVDIDDLIELKENMSISEIFSNYGEDYFRKIENITLRSIGNSEISPRQCMRKLLFALHKSVLAQEPP